MNDNKLCPMSFNRKDMFEFCKAEKCAWWYQSEDCCSILLIAMAQGEKTYRERMVNSYE